MNRANYRQGLLPYMHTGQLLDPTNIGSINIFISNILNRISSISKNSKIIFSISLQRLLEEFIHIIW